MKRVKVMVFGTFDILHPGHLHFLKQAKKLGNFLVVSVARDRNAAKFKGFIPTFSEQDRLELVRNISAVDRAVLGGSINYLPHILREKPDVIALGYDQKAYATELLIDIRAKKLSIEVVRLKPFRASKYKSSVYKKKIKR
jgi:FAD synthetase